MPIAVNVRTLPVLPWQATLSILSHPRIYADVIGPYLGRLAYMSHVVYVTRRLSRVSGRCRALRRRLPGYGTAIPDTLQCRFVSTGGITGGILNRGPELSSTSTGAPTHRSCARPASPNDRVPLEGPPTSTPDQTGTRTPRPKHITAPPDSPSELVADSPTREIRPVASAWPPPEPPVSVIGASSVADHGT